MARGMGAEELRARIAEYRRRGFPVGGYRPSTPYFTVEELELLQVGIHVPKPRWLTSPPLTEAELLRARARARVGTGAR